MSSYPKSSFMHRLGEYRLGTQAASEQKSPRTEQKKTFVQNSLTPRFLRTDDTVLILVPEELEIHGGIDPGMHGRIGKIVSPSCAGDSVEVQLVRKARDSEDLDYSYADRFYSKPEVVTVPTFCLSLEKKHFHQRMCNPRFDEELYLPKTGRSNSLADLDEEEEDCLENIRARYERHSIGVAGFLDA